MEKETAYLKFVTLNSETENCEYLGMLIFNRLEKANAFDAEMIEKITSLLIQAREKKRLRALIIMGAERHFSIGADLDWMKDSINLSQADNLYEIEMLTAMFDVLYNLSVPTIAVVRGLAYGGGLGLIGCCDFAIAQKGSRFCISELKIGLIPAVILYYLKKKIGTGDLNRFALGASVFGVEEAKRVGLIQVVCNSEELNNRVHIEMNNLLTAAPQSQKEYKKLFRHLSQQPPRDMAIKLLASIRKGTHAQQGLDSAIRKKKPQWMAKVPEYFKFIPS